MQEDEWWIVKIWRFHNNLPRAFISPTWMHIQIISNGRAILHQYHVFIFYDGFSM